MKKESKKIKSKLYILSILVILLVIIGGYKYLLDKKENEKINTVQSSTESLIEQVRSTGKLTNIDYNKLVDELNSTGYQYNLELSVKTMRKIPMRTENKEILENQYYDIYTSQILEELNKSGVYYFNEGETLTVTITSFKKEINGQYSGLVIVNGK